VGDVAGSVRLLAQKEVKLPASGIERALLQFFRFESVDEGATFIIDPVVQNSLDAFLLREGFSFRLRMISPPSAHRLSTCF
jgi:hypothetical protein